MIKKINILYGIGIMLLLQPTHYTYCMEEESYNYEYASDNNTTLLELLKTFMDNWAESKNLVAEALNAHSPIIQFNTLASCIEMSSKTKNKCQATELFEILKIVYNNYFLDTEQAPTYQQKFENFAKEYSEPPLEKFGSADSFAFCQLEPVYQIQEQKAPRRSSRSPRNIPKNHGLDWHKPLSVKLIDAACIFQLKGHFLFSANEDGTINCYNIKSGIWIKTLQYPGKTPLLFTPISMAIQNKSIMRTQVDDIISLLSSQKPTVPSCVLYTKKNDSDTSYILEGNENGTLIMHDLTAKKEFCFDEKHAAAITALLAFPHIAYSGSKDRSIKKWNVKERKCENSLEEMEDTVHDIVSFQGNIIALIGDKKLVLCNLSEKPAKQLTLFQLSSKEPNNTLERIIAFEDKYLIAGTKKGQLKVFTAGRGFTNVSTIEQNISIKVPIKSLTNFDDEKLLVQYGDDVAMIFSKEKSS